MQTKGPALAEASPVFRVAGGEGGQMAGAIVGGDRRWQVRGKGPESKEPAV